MFCKFDSLRIYSRNSSISRKSHTDCLCQTVHGVCCVHTGTGSTGRAYLFFVLSNLILCHSTCCVGTNCLEHGRKTSLFAMNVTSQHRAAAYEYSRDIQSCCCHQKSRYVFVTVRNHNQCIELMCHCHTLCGICDQITGNQRVFHSCMSHCNTITNCDCREHDRCTACHCNTHFYSFYDFIQVHMTRYDLIIGTYDTY